MTLPVQLVPRLLQLGFFVSSALNGSEYIVPPLCDVPAGGFLFGSDPLRDTGAYDNELPQQSMALTAYKIAKCPVTVAEYACFVRARQQEPDNWQQQLGKPDHPVVHISWYDAVGYAQWLSERSGQLWRLPSEAEWEKAARGTDGRIYPWDDTFRRTRCNTSEGKRGGTTRSGELSERSEPVWRARYDRERVGMDEQHH